MNSTLIGMSAALLSAASWAVGAILFKRLGELASPFGMTLSKGIVSVVLLGVVLIFIGYESIPLHAAGLLFLSGILGIAIGDTLFFAALQDLGPNALIVFFMSGQILTALLAVVFLGEVPPPAVWGGIIITVVGIGIVLWAKILRDDEKRSSGIRGIILGSLFMLSMSVSIIIAKPALDSVSTVWATFIRMAAGSLGILLFGVCTKKVSDWINPFLNKRMLALFITSVAVVTFGGFWLSIVAIKYVDVAIANTLGATEALFVLPLSYFFLKEKIAPLEIVGTLLAVCGVIVICIN